MATAEGKISPSRSEPLQALESPFLGQELFTRQGAEEWEAHLGVLEEEGAFLRAFEQPWAQPPSYQKAEPVPRSEAEDYELEQGITGEDDRVEVADTTVAPYRWICSVTYEKSGATLDGGSGVLISDRHVLTAGHVIKEAGSGPDAPSLVIYPGRHYGGEPFGRYLASRTRLPNFKGMDFGLITLTTPVEPALLWWGHPSTNTDWWSEAAIPLRQLRQTALPITTAGFPGAKDAYRRRMYEARGETVPARFGGVFRHTADTTRGQSGSPIWTERQGRRILIGLATAFDELPNQIAVFAHDNLMQRVLRQWMAQDAPRPPRVERRIALEIPYRWACRLEVYDNDLRRTVGYGSGLLISNQHVLTSARVIHGFVQDRRRYAVSVAPGYEFGKEAFGSTTAAKGRTSPRFSPDSKDAAAEFGLLTLSRALGTASFAAIKNAALGSWGGANHGIVSSAGDWSGKPAHIAAFSRSAGGGGAYQKLRVSSGGFVGLTSGQILHRAGSKLDAPGAPLWVEAGDRRLLVGVATTVFSKDSEVNWGCYLSEEAQSHLRQWMNEDFEGHETEAADRFTQDETEIFAAEGGGEPEPEGVKAADESDGLPDMERGSALEVEDGMAGPAPAEWAMEWVVDEDEGPLTSAGSVETEQDTRLEYDTPPMTQAISDAIDQKDWPRLLELAMQVGWHDENQLTNLLFYSRHPELDRRKLDPKKNKDDLKLADEWNRILVKEIRPAIHKAAEDSTLEVHGNLVAERDPELAGEKGAKFRELVAWAAGEVDMDPGFLAAVLLAEVGRASPYLSTGEVRSFFTGTDDFFAQRAQLRAHVPAFAKVHFDEKKKTTSINEHGRGVTTIPYRTGKDAALATAVYLKWGETKLRRAMQKNGGDFDTLSVPTRFVLVRVAMAAGHGGISPDGDLIRFKKKGDALVTTKPGESCGILLGVARSLDRVLKGEDILVRNFEPRKDPTNDSHITHRNATILASQAMHLGDWFFRAQPLGIQPEFEESAGSFDEAKPQVALLESDAEQQVAPVACDSRQPADMTFAEIIATIECELRRKFLSEEDPGLFRRRLRLRELVNGVPPSQAKSFHDQLRDPSDPLGQLLSRRVHPATRRDLLAILFFAEYDLRFEPISSTSGVPAHPTMTQSQKKTRIDHVQAMVDVLNPRLLTRAADALKGVVTPAAPVEPAKRPIAIALSDAQLALFREFFPDGRGGMDLSDFQISFEQFANGELRDSSVPGKREPNGAFFFLFAEFAFLCADSGISTTEWTRLLRIFVETQEIFMHVYRTPPHSAPPPVDTGLPSIGAALRTDLNAFFNDSNFSKVGQSDLARKRALRRKYTSMNINQLRNAAAKNLRRAQRMP